MTMSDNEIRQLVLEELQKTVMYQRGSARQVQVQDVIHMACERAKQTGHGPGDARIIESLYGLFREGVLSWGLNRNNCTTSYAHLTPFGDRVLEEMAQDPLNPTGYFASLQAVVATDSIAWGYIAEAVESHRHGCDRGAAVLIGCAAESLLLEVRDALVQKLREHDARVPSAFTGWIAKPVIDEVDRVLRGSSKAMPRALRERFDAYWMPLFHHVRFARNEAGHPTSVRPVERAAVHANLLLFPTLARLAIDVRDWISSEFVPPV